ncbi:translation initiation factor IF-2 [Mus musculus]|uniref:translation initiation factor IF-2 n=1 Tax=Mus musculus TaxID=10090 RepID=UPI0011AE41D6|nr:translation initiation factor IF-2 [Mus musculus]
MVLSHFVQAPTAPALIIFIEPIHGWADTGAGHTCAVSISRPVGPRAARAAGFKNDGGGGEAAAEGGRERPRPGAGQRFLVQAPGRSQPSEVWFHKRDPEARGRTRTPRESGPAWERPEARPTRSHCGWGSCGPGLEPLPASAEAPQPAPPRSAPRPRARPNWTSAPRRPGPRLPTLLAAKDTARAAREPQTLPARPARAPAAPRCAAPRGASSALSGPPCLPEAEVPRPRRRRRPGLRQSAAKFCTMDSSGRSEARAARGLARTAGSGARRQPRSRRPGQAALAPRRLRHRRSPPPPCLAAPSLSPSLLPRGSAAPPQVGALW